MPYSTFSYLYRDAANNKQFNQVLLKGRATQTDCDTILDALQDGEHFIPDGVGLPSLQGRWAELGSFSSSDDHFWHEFVSLTAASEKECERLTCWGNKNSLVKNFAVIKDWNLLLQKALLRAES